MIVNGTKPLEAPIDEPVEQIFDQDGSGAKEPSKPPIETRRSGRRSPKKTPVFEIEPRAGDTDEETSDGPPDLQQRVEELEDRLDRLGVICEAMWQLLSGEVGLSLDQLAAKVDEQSFDDAVTEDGPESPEPMASCPDCGNSMPLGAKTCLFCSARPNGTTLD